MALRPPIVTRAHLTESGIFSLGLAMAARSAQGKESRYHGHGSRRAPSRAPRNQHWARVQELSLAPVWRLGRPKYLGAGDQIRSIVPVGPPPATEPLLSGVASSGNRSLKLPCLRKKDGVVQGVAQYGRRCLGKGQDAGGPFETACSAGDLEGQSTQGLIRREIDAIASVREIDNQQAPVNEAKQAGAGHTLKERAW